MASAAGLNELTKKIWIKCLKFNLSAQLFPLLGEVVLLKFKSALQGEQSCNGWLEGW